MTKSRSRAPFSVLFEPVLTAGERASINLSMARAGYESFQRKGGEEPDWDALPVFEKERWAMAVRASFRVMLSLVAEISVEEETA